MMMGKGQPQQQQQQQQPYELAPHPPGFERSVYACRAVALALIVSACAHAEALDARLAVFWSWARETRLMRWDTFEPFLVVTSFTVCLLGWSAVDLGRFGSHAWSARYRLQPAGPKGKTHREHSAQIWKPEGYGLQEFVLYLAPLLVFDWVYPRRVLPEEPPTAAEQGPRAERRQRRRKVAVAHQLALHSRPVRP